MAETKDELPVPDPIVGHKTLRNEDGSTRHEPLRQSEAAVFLAQADAEKQRRAELMPDEKAAASMMWQAYQRLRELGWRETCYGPTNVTVKLIEPGSAGIHEGSRWEPWPSKDWWIQDAGDSWPSTPCLFRPLDASLSSGRSGSREASNG